MTKTDLQYFFKRRMVELLHKDTLDSYRVRVNNVMTILIELDNVLENWMNGNVKRYETVSYCIQECKFLLENDDCFEYDETEVTKSTLTQQFDKFTSKSKSGEIDISSAKKLQFMVQKCILLNKNKYLDALLRQIKTEMDIDEPIPDDQFMPTLNKLDTYISAFACELLRLGHSKIHLYKFFVAFKENKRHLSFQDAFEEMKGAMTSLQSEEYVVVFKLGFQSEDRALRASENIPGLKESLSDELKNAITGRYLSYKKEKTNIRFVTMEKAALDSAMAAKICYDDLSNMFDLNLEYTKEVDMPSIALVFCKQQRRQGYNVALEHIYILDKGSFVSDDENKSLPDAMRNIDNNTNISNDVKDRISVALRHLRIGDHQIEIEQQFINYWIAIEFIFTSPSSKESTFERIKKYLPDILGSGYIKRNCLYLNEILRNSHAIKADEYWWNKSDDDREKLIKSLSSNILVQYRMRKMKSHLRSNEAINKYIKNHRNNLVQHLSRIYRLRNELIHEAAIKQDIANVTSNLRSYLVYVLNQLIDFFNNTNDICTAREMEQFFWSYENKLAAVVKSDSIDVVMAIPIAVGYVN